MSCCECKDGKMGGTANCEDCVKKQNVAIIRFLNGDATYDEVIYEFGVVDMTSGWDVDKPLTLDNYLNDDVEMFDGAKPLYDVKYWEMVRILEDEKSDILNLRRPIDLDKDVARLREVLWEKAWE